MRKFATILLFIAVIAVISSLLGQQAWSSDGIEEIKKRGYLLWGSDAEGGAPYVFPDPKNPSRLIKQLIKDSMLLFILLYFII